jgi:hypothetical protein
LYIKQAKYHHGAPISKISVLKDTTEKSKFTIKPKKPAYKHLKMSLPLAPKPKTQLEYHRILSPSAAIKVSPLCLGTMNFGEAWYDAKRPLRPVVEFAC